MAGVAEGVLASDASPVAAPLALAVVLPPEAPAADPTLPAAAPADDPTPLETPALGADPKPPVAPTPVDDPKPPAAAAPAVDPKPPADPETPLLAPAAPGPAPLTLPGAWTVRPLGSL